MNIIEDKLSTIILQPFYFCKNFDCIMKGTIGNDGLRQSPGRLVWLDAVTKFMGILPAFDGKGRDDL
jgi:hypothetical protein